MLLIQSGWAWAMTHQSICTNFRLWLWKHGRDISQKTASCSKGWFYRVLNENGCKHSCGYYQAHNVPPYIYSLVKIWSSMFMTVHCFYRLLITPILPQVGVSELYHQNLPNISEYCSVGRKHAKTNKKCVKGNTTGEVLFSPTMIPLQTWWNKLQVKSGENVPVERLTFSTLVLM